MQSNFRDSISMTIRVALVLVAAVFLITSLQSGATTPGNSNAEIIPTAGSSPTPSTTGPAAPAMPALEAPSPASTATSVNAINYSMDWYSINGGGTTNTSSTNYRIGASVAQSVTGQASSTNFQMGIGFWYGVSGCSCPYQGDINNSGSMNVLDVVAVINRVFKGAAPVQDPLCPRERADFNANGAINVLDVVGVINRVFKSGPLPVNPCGSLLGQ